MGADGDRLPGGEAATAQPVRSSLVLCSQGAFIQWPYKVVLGSQGGKGVWTGAQSPNKTKVVDHDPGCGSGENDKDPGCLFNIECVPACRVRLFFPQRS